MGGFDGVAGRHGWEWEMSPSLSPSRFARCEKTTSVGFCVAFEITRSVEGRRLRCTLYYSFRLTDNVIM